MGRKKPLKYRELRKILKRYGVEESRQHGKGSERMFVGVVNGRRVTYPTICHSEGDDKPVPVIEAIRRAFSLTEDHGVTDEASTERDDNRMPAVESAV
uniref:Type II toxin-antitoxin system HicA family toxin n=1 Tax=Schlesneria paludicola TaxID=360056 RepID=A0A7C2P0E9_9PLAN